ncbi:GGDEF domain-containing protein [Roseibium aggregatum]|uniref:diguanylate cyclase n=1 Tax=Roseibium aggregatum TaxID=187304 RepID=A0A0M6YDW4_9HYPH|nr:GGDEF domain-containing protein [Roseibium aggregatum]CTQ47437.1 Stalked cell differentiation-controlling protein [Roseibium aggregatum]
MDEVLEQLIQLYEKTPVMVAAYDAFDRLRYANPAFRSAWFIDPDASPTWPEIIRRNYTAERGTVIRARNIEDWLHATQSRRGKTGFRAFETDLTDGRWLWMTETVLENGWMLCIASDITSLHCDERSVRQDLDYALKAAQVDELTSVANRRFVMARIEDMLEQLQFGHLTSGCLAVLDIDHFKSVNDRYGHQSGDMVLRDFAHRIQQLVRRTDCFGRVGGEEFMLVCPNTTTPEALLVLERMLANVWSSRPLSGHPDFRYAFSAGIAEVLTDDIAFSLCSRADKALYAAKMAGRGRIFGSDQIPDRSTTTG